jgi:hypothetical protein
MGFRGRWGVLGGLGVVGPRVHTLYKAQLEKALQRNGSTSSSAAIGPPSSSGSSGGGGGGRASGASTPTRGPGTPISDGGRGTIGAVAGMQITPILHPHKPPGNQATLGLPYDPYEVRTLPKRIIGVGGAVNFPSVAGLVGIDFFFFCFPSFFVFMIELILFGLRCM